MIRSSRLWVGGYSILALLIATVVYGVHVTAPEAAAPRPEATVVRAALLPTPDSVVGAFWSPDAGSLTVVDADHVSVYPLPSGQGDVLPHPAVQSLLDPSPSSVRVWGDGYLLAASGTVNYLDSDLYTAGRYDVDQGASPRDVQILRLLSWCPVRGFSRGPAGGDTEVFAAARVVVPPNREEFAYIRFDLRDPRRVSVLTHPTGDPIYPRYHDLGFDLIASAGATAYVLDFTQPFPRLLASPGMATPDLVPLSADLLPGKGVPDLAPSIIPSARSRAESFSAFERSTMPCGLYAHRGRLYVLLHVAVADHRSGPRWLLRRLDPRSGETESDSVIPTRAENLTVVPGDRWWAFLESGPSQAGVKPGPRTVLLVPARWVQGGES